MTVSLEFFVRAGIRILTVLRTYLSHYAHIQLDNEYRKETEADVQLFVESRLAKYEAWPVQLRDEVKQKITNRAEGVYLWAAFVMQVLNECEVVEVESSLKELPKGLNDMYHRIVQMIRPERRETAAKLLKWVCGAFRRLRLNELSAVTGVSPAAGQSLEDATRDQLRFCNHLLEVHNGEVSFCHTSVREYFLTHQSDLGNISDKFVFNLDTIHTEITDLCLDHSEQCLSTEESTRKLCQYIYKEEYNRESPKVPSPNVASHCGETLPYPLMEYGFHWWGSHAKKATLSYWQRNLERPFWLSKTDTYGPRSSHVTQENEPLSVRQRWWSIQYNEAHLFYELSSSWAEDSAFQFASYFGIVNLAICLLGTCKTDEQCAWLLNQAEVQTGRTPLIYACGQGHVEMVRFLLSRGVRIDHQDEDGYTALMHACERNLFAIAEMLVKKHANLRLCTTRANRASVADGEQKLNPKALYSHVPTHPELGFIRRKRPTLQSVLDIDPVKPKPGLTALHFAATHGHIDLVQLLCDHGADINVPDSTGRTALSLAIRQGFVEIQQFLISLGSSLSTVDQSGKTLLHDAVMSPYLDGDVVNMGSKWIVEYLLDHALDVNVKDLHGMTPLHLAAAFSSISILERLIRAGANPNEVDGKRRDALATAALVNRTDSVKYLLLASAADPRLEEHKIKALHVAVCAGSQSVIQFLLDDGLHVDVSYENGWTPLQTAVDFLPKSFGAMEPLLRNGADVNSAPTGPPPLMQALYAGHYDAVDLLLAWDANVNLEYTTAECTPLHIAIQNGLIRGVKWLLMRGADCNKPMLLPSGDSLYPLILALFSIYSRAVIVQLLIDHGANLYVKHLDGKNILDLAIKHGRLRFLKVLLSRYPTAELIRDTFADFEERSFAQKIASIPPHEGRQHAIFIALTQAKMEDTEKRRRAAASTSHDDVSVPGTNPHDSTDQRPASNPRDPSLVERRSEEVSKTTDLIRLAHCWNTIAANLPLQSNIQYQDRELALIIYKYLTDQTLNPAAFEYARNMVQTATEGDFECWGRGYTEEQFDMTEAEEMKAHEEYTANQAESSLAKRERLNFARKALVPLFELRSKQKPSKDDQRDL